METYKRWKAYQKKLQRKTFGKRILPVGVWVFIPVVLLVLGTRFWKFDFSGNSLTNSAAKESASEISVVSKEDFWNLIDPKTVLNASNNEFEITYEGNNYFLETTIDIPFQQYMAERILSSQAPAGAFVALNPTNGEILSVIEFNHMPGLDHPSLIGRFPAASLFKIVTAAAAIEEQGYRAESTMSYSGRKHTLYRKQLTDQINRYANQISLKKSFAQSINPIFGKLGSLHLKKELLEKYAARFGFNEVIGFELPIEPSGFVVGDDPYDWAEIASGFNRRTVISPVHAAVIAASTLNGGKLMAPTIVRRMTDKNNHLIYEGAPNVIRQAISPEASLELKTLMMETITHGTSRRAFRGYNRDRVLSKIDMGGKTGTIKNQSGDLLYDWFVGFAADRKGDRKLAIGVLMVHNTLLRARSQEYARLAFKEYFKAKPPAGT